MVLLYLEKVLRLATSVVGNMIGVTLLKGHIGSSEMVEVKV